MITNGQILAEVKQLKGSLKALESVIEVQERLIHSLRQDNRDLLNRLMVRSMQEYASVSPASVAEMDFTPARELARSDEFAQEHLAGTVIENET